jgi:ketosteroid isomerase-like protein
MPPESKVEIVKRFVDAFNRVDVDAVVADLDLDVELHEWPTAPGARSYRGPDGVRQALETWFEVWEWMRVEITELVENGDRVLVSMHQKAKGRGSEIEVEIDSYNVYTFDDGKVTRMELFTEREPALEAAGLKAETAEQKR